METSFVTANRKNWIYVDKIFVLEAVGLGPTESLWPDDLWEWDTGHSKRQEEIICDVEISVIYQVEFYN